MPPFLPNSQAHSFDEKFRESFEIWVQKHFDEAVKPLADETTCNQLWGTSLSFPPFLARESLLLVSSKLVMVVSWWSYARQMSAFVGFR